MLIIPKPSNAEKNLGGENLKEKNRTVRWKGAEGDNWNNIEMSMKNNHPTVKSIKLFNYLLTLARNKGDLVLDPFMG